MFPITPDVCATLTGDLERSFEEDEKDKDGSSNGKSKGKSEEEEPIPDCTLVAEIQVWAMRKSSPKKCMLMQPTPGTLPTDLLDEVRVTLTAACIDTHYSRLHRLMKELLSAMNYDANKLPLGKLSKNTILSGFAALKVRALGLSL